MANSHENNETLIKVGIVRPISSMDNEHTEQHWANLHEIVSRALYDDENYKFDFSLVSEQLGSHFIQSTIISNLYNDHVVICDTSKHNPNVLYELGLRMAFQKPCIIIQEKGQKIAFDLSLIKYEEYPFNFNYLDITDFQDRIRKSVINSYDEFYNKNEGVAYSSIFDKAGIKPVEIKETKLNEIDYLDSRISELVSKIPTASEISKLVISEIENNKLKDSRPEEIIRRKAFRRELSEDTKRNSLARAFGIHDSFKINDDGSNSNVPF